MNKKLFIFATVLLLIIAGNARLFSEQYAFHMLRRNKGWTFLDRIKLGQGTAQIRFNVKMLIKDGQTTKTYPVQLSMVPDSLWASQQLMKCSREASTIINSETNQGGQQKSFTGVLSPDNNYEFGMLQVVQIPQTQTYHFILKDCQKLITSDYFSRQSRLAIQLQIKNNGKDYGEDEGGNFYWFPFLIVGTAIMIKFVHQSFVKGSFDVKQTDYVKYLVSSCLWMNLISLVFKYIGYLIYIYFGKDYSFFDFVYLFFHAVADSIVISILIFVSYGWTITFIKDTDFDLYVPLVCMMGLITVILTLLNKITDGAHDKYHMYDTIPSYLLVFFKFVTIIIFLAGCIKTIYKSKDNKIKNFMYEILVLGSFYILSVPGVMLAVQYIPASQRKQWVFFLIELIKTFIIFLLAYMISYKKSGYRSVALGDQSFMQVGNRFL